jgi:hypothetical protein
MLTDVGAQFIAPVVTDVGAQFIAPVGGKGTTWANVSTGEGAIHCAPTSGSPPLDRHIDAIISDISDVGAQFIAPPPVGAPIQMDIPSYRVASSRLVVIPTKGAMNCAPTSVSPRLDPFIDAIKLDSSGVGAQFIAPSSLRVPSHLFVPFRLVVIPPEDAMNCAPTKIWQKGKSHDL